MISGIDEPTLFEAANAGAVSECLRTLSVDPMPGRPPPMCLVATHREDMQPAFAQQVSLDYGTDRPTRLAWPPGVELQLPAVESRAGVVQVSHAEGVVSGKCVTCRTTVKAGPDAWAQHCETPMHRAWTDPSLEGTRADARVGCQLCGCGMTCAQWPKHVKTQGHVARGRR